MKCRTHIVSDYGRYGRRMMGHAGRLLVVSAPRHQSGAVQSFSPHHSHMFALFTRLGYLGAMLVLTRKRWVWTVTKVKIADENGPLRGFADHCFPLFNATNLVFNSRCQPPNINCDTGNCTQDCDIHLPGYKMRLVCSLNLRHRFRLHG